MREHIEINTTNIEPSLNSSSDGVNGLHDCDIRKRGNSSFIEVSSLRNQHEQSALSSHRVDDKQKSSSLANSQSDSSSNNLELVAKRSYTPALEGLLGLEKNSRILSDNYNERQAKILDLGENKNCLNSHLGRAKISLNGTETSVLELRNLAKEAGVYDAEIGPRENSMVITQDGSKFKALSISAGGDNHGNKNFLSGALLQMYVAKFPWYMTKGKSHGVGLEAHTHQTNIPGTDPYVFSYPDILNGQGKNWSQVVSTDDGCILFKQTGSKSQIPEGCFDPIGGFHKTIINPNGTYSTELETSSSDEVKCLRR